MKKFTNTLFRGLLTLAVAGLGLALTPREARAELVFQVDETVLPDTGPFCAVEDCTFDADKLNGFYDEVLTINADFTFDASARGFFSAYVLDGGPTGTGNIGCQDTDSIFTDHCYAVFVLFQGSGSVDPLTGVITFADADIFVGLDPDGSNTYTAPGSGAAPWTVTDTTADDEDLILSADLLKGTGQLTPPVGGFFDLVFGNIDISAFGNLYWPGLESFSLTAVVDGDFDTVPSPPVPGTYSLEGDFSAVFPEPASLALFGIGLLASGIAVRRRRRSA